MCLILDGNYERVLSFFDSSDLTPLDFFLWVWMKGEVGKRKVDTRDELVACIFDVAVPCKET